jgi:hypothetical protein
MQRPSPCTNLLFFPAEIDFPLVGGLEYLGDGRRSVQTEHRSHYGRQRGLWQRRGTRGVILGCRTLELLKQLGSRDQHEWHLR